ncbi:MAG: 2-oxoglutarate dehydrogenase complex dihydrolipoyllysine-residue succinyltransferase [Albidovulum sp.]|nr:2-oxoglutarate dehydrogenase complex dihydrolipoyllysine-residue succinyltransferase [Albidovulum sp.]
MTTEVRVPPLGESITEAIVGTWHKTAGDPVSADEMLCELETDKVSVEISAPKSGVLAEIAAPQGETVEPGTLLATINEGSVAANENNRKAPDSPRPSKPNGDEAEIKVVAPALGESVAEATVAKWSKSEGDAVEVDETLCELETDKVTLEVPAPASGILSAIIASEGSAVAPGDVLASVLAGGAASVSADHAPAPRADTEDAPSARKILEERGIDPGEVQGTGRDGRVMKDDALRAVNEAEPIDSLTRESKRVEDSDSSREERVRMTMLRQTIARRLKESQNTAAILTTYNEADMSKVMEIRREYRDLFQKRHGVRLGFMSFFVKACCTALDEVPEVNAEIDGTDIVFKNYVHMGIAVGSPTGLVVPVLRNAHAMGFAEIEKRIADASTRARDGKLTLAEMQGGTFSISNGGIYGSLMSSPIINPPQSGILGMHKIQDRPVAVGGQVAIRPMMYLALSYDHRIVDGKGAVTFLVRVKESLEDPRRLLMGI